MKVWSLSYKEFSHLKHIFPDARMVAVGHIGGFEPEKGDVVIFHGGTDISTSLYNEERGQHTQRPNKERDAFEVEAYKKSQEVGAMCFGICRGHQLFNVLNGGKLVQHMHGHNGGTHHLLEAPFRVNSYHHQAIHPEFFFGEKLLSSYDNIIEAAYWPDTKCFSVQFHPEWGQITDPFVQWTLNTLKEKYVQQQN